MFNNIKYNNLLIIITIDLNNIYFYITDLKSYMVKTLTSLKYRIDGLETLTQTIHLNIEKLIERNNETAQCSNVLNEESLVDMDSIFPIKTEEELQAFETLITNIDIRRMMVILYVYNVYIIIYIFTHT